MLLGLPSAVVRADDAFNVEPSRVVLDDAFARAQLLVRLPGNKSVENLADLTQRATYQSSQPNVATVSSTGQVLARGDGEAEITITANGKKTRAVPVRVTGMGPRPQIRFDEHVLPILSKAGCNAGACHASQYGQGGFKLSVFASDASADHFAMVRAASRPGA